MLIKQIFLLYKVLCIHGSLFIIISEIRIQKIRKNEYNIDVKRYIDKLPN